MFSPTEIRDSLRMDRLNRLRCMRVHTTTRFSSSQTNAKDENEPARETKPVKR